MQFLSPIVFDVHNLLIREPIGEYLCPYCDNRGNCSIKKYYLASDYNKCKEEIFLKLENDSNLTNVVYLIGEHTLVDNRKELYALSKEIFNFNKTITQTLFTNVEVSDLLKLTSAYKYLTYVDYIMQTKYVDYINSKDEFDCVFKNAAYIDLTKTFTNGKTVYKNF